MQVRLSFKFSNSTRVNCFCLETKKLTVSAKSSGLLIGCGKKTKILRHFQGKLCGQKGPLCGKLCDFF